MSHVPHELKEEFPEFSDKMHDLKMSDAHFAKLAEEYHIINRDIHRLENGDEHVSQFSEEDLRKRRMALKDEIYGLLKA